MATDGSCTFRTAPRRPRWSRSLCLRPRPAPRGSLRPHSADGLRRGGPLQSRPNKTFTKARTPVLCRAAPTWRREPSNLQRVRKPSGLSSLVTTNLCSHLSRRKENAAARAAWGKREQGAGMRRPQRGCLVHGSLSGGYFFTLSTAPPFCLFEHHLDLYSGDSVSPGRQEPEKRS